MGNLREVATFLPFFLLLAGAEDIFEAGFIEEVLNLLDEFWVFTTLKKGIQTIIFI